MRVLIEGEEEIGSPTLHAFLDAHVDELRSDVLVLADAGNWKVGVPGLTYSLRGLAAADIELRALDGPVHSGMAGGAIPDPVMALARLLASLVDEHGDVAIDGLWDDVRPPTDAGAGADRRASTTTPTASRARWASGPGVQLVGDPGTTLHERLWFRPSLTVIGIDAPPDQGLVEPDRRPRDGARSACASRPGQDPDRVHRATARARRAARAVGTRAARSPRSKARPRGRPIRPVPRSTRRAARCARASAPSRC